MICASLIFLFFTGQAVSFNVVTDGNYPRYFVSTITKPIFGSEFRELPKNQPASFFGYYLAFHKQTLGSVMTLILGAPKHMNPAYQFNQHVGPQRKYNSTETQGNINSCFIPRTLFTRRSAVSLCSQRVPRDTLPGDGIGISMTMNDNGNTVACPYGRPMDCDSSQYYPGFCYRATRAGKVWRRAKQNIEFECPVNGVDIIFVLDGSQSIGGHNFIKVKTWVTEVAKRFNIDSGGNRVGVIQYSHFYEGWDLNDQTFIKTEVELGQAKTFEELKAILEGVYLHNYTTYTAHALNKTVLDFQAFGRLADPSIKQVMILLTDGVSTDKQYLTYSANYVRSFGIQTYAIGVAEADQNELRTIATGDLRSGERVYQVENFTDLANIIDSLQRDIMSNTLEAVAPENHNKLSMAQSGISASINEVS